MKSFIIFTKTNETNYVYMINIVEKQCEIGLAIVYMQIRSLIFLTLKERIIM